MYLSIPSRPSSLSDLETFKFGSLGLTQWAFRQAHSWAFTIPFRTSGGPPTNSECEQKAAYICKCSQEFFLLKRLDWQSLRLFWKSTPNCTDERQKACRATSKSRYAPSPCVTLLILQGTETRGIRSVKGEVWGRELPTHFSNERTSCIFSPHLIRAIISD